MPLTTEEIGLRFTYHSPSPEQLSKYRELRAKAHELALLIVELVPDGPEHHVAVRKVEEAVMVANAGIARRSQ